MLQARDQEAKREGPLWGSFSKNVCTLYGLVKEQDLFVNHEIDTRLRIQGVDSQNKFEKMKEPPPEDLYH